jgi:hypothetical protein
MRHRNKSIPFRQFFDLSAAKGGSNIPKNEPSLARAAMEAASAAQRRPRPPSKFYDPSSSGPFPTSRFSGPTNVVNSTRAGQDGNRDAREMAPQPRSTPAAEKDRAASNYELGSLLTPRTAENHLSSIFGLQNGNETGHEHCTARQDSREDDGFSTTMDAFEMTKSPEPLAKERENLKNTTARQPYTGGRHVFSKDDTSEEQAAPKFATGLEQSSLSPIVRNRNHDGVKAQMRLPVKRVGALNLHIPAVLDELGDNSKSISMLPPVHDGLQNRKSDPVPAVQPSHELASGSSGVFSIPSSSDTPQDFLLVGGRGLLSPDEQQQRWYSQADHKVAERLQSGADREFLGVDEETDSQFFDLADESFKARDTDFAMTTSELNEFSLPSPSEIGLLPFTAPQSGPIDRTAQD